MFAPLHLNNPYGEKKVPSKIITILLSILLPGLGQVFQRKFRAGISIFLAFATALAVTLSGMPNRFGLLSLV